MRKPPKEIMLHFCDSCNAPPLLKPGPCRSHPYPLRALGPNLTPARYVLDEAPEDAKNPEHCARREERERLERALLTVLREAAIIAGSHDQGDRRGWTAEEVEKQASLIPQLAAAGRLILAEAVKARSVTVDDILAALAEQGEPDDD